MAKTSNDKILTIFIVFISIAGLLYFGLSAIRADSKKTNDNPFEYNIENYEKSGAELVKYHEATTLDIALAHLHAIAVDHHDQIFVTSAESLMVLNERGEKLAATVAGAKINALDVDANGDIYVALENQIELLDSTFAPTKSWRVLGENAYLTSVAVGDSDVYVADAGQRIIWRFDKNGELLNTLGEKDETKDVPGFIIPSPYFDVFIDPDGSIWAVNTGRHQFENYWPDGRLRSTWSKSSMAVDGFSGCCNPVHAAILPDGSFVTSEKGIVRVKIHNAVGELEAVVAMPEQFDRDAVFIEVAVNSHEQILVLDPKRKQVRFFQKKETTL
jgi:hypothetical protein